jgi:hypothetical protein
MGHYIDGEGSECKIQGEVANRLADRPVDSDPNRQRSRFPNANQQLNRRRDSLKNYRINGCQSGKSNFHPKSSTFAADIGPITLEATFIEGVS